LTVDAATPPAPATRTGRRWLRRVLLALLALMVAPFILTLGYAVVPPISMPMIGRALMLQDVQRDWVSFDEIAPALPQAVLASEDARFCLHNGVDFVELEKVLSREGGPSRGASTITMQVAKNLYLWPLPTLMRKGAEIPLALWIDLVWPKRRTLEVYLNIAEWGDGIFGAEAAAQAHFGKRAADLSAREAALLAAALPNPIKRDAGNPTNRLRGRAGTITARARQSGDLMECIK
jgi:monofunctional biosynthetic peptidoglycan transglycosylase